MSSHMINGRRIILSDNTTITSKRAMLRRVERGHEYNCNRFSKLGYRLFGAMYICGACLDRVEYNE